MRKAVLFYVALVATLSVASGCRKENAGDVVTRDIPVERTYSSVEVNSAIEVTYSGTAETMSVKAQEKLFAYLDIRQTDGKLSISIDQNRLWNIRPVEIVLPSSLSLSEIKIGGASSFTSQIPIKNRDLRIEMSGASYFEARVEAENMANIEVSGASDADISLEASAADIDMSGASRLRISGSSPACVLDVSGASKMTGYSGYYFSSDNFRCDISGASKVELASDGNISGEISGASKLACQGNAVFALEVSGDSKVTRL